VPIRWSASKVSETANRIEEQLNQAIEPLQRAREVAKEARGIANLPGYIDQDFIRIIGEIDDCLGGTEFRPVGWFKATIEHIRKDIPSGTVEQDQASLKYGSTQALV